MDVKVDNFNWEIYERGYKGGNILFPNDRIKGLSKKDKVFSHEPYAQELFNLLNGPTQKWVKKDLKMGDCVVLSEIPYIDKDRMTIELLGGLTTEIDLNREKKFLGVWGYTSGKDFSEALGSEEARSSFISHGIQAFVISSEPVIRVSLWEGHLQKAREEFMSEIKFPSKAYVAKILSANRGGYFVEVQGLEAFMPGSLAAPNKIIDFYSLVGKEVIVMIEDFLKEMNSFIVSHKKYIEYILPSRLEKLDPLTKYRGRITGTSKYGIFSEFEEIFTGLLHTSKMSAETLDKFRRRDWNPGDEIEFWIEEISKDNRIILTEAEPKKEEE